MRKTFGQRGPWFGLTAAAAVIVTLGGAGMSAGAGEATGPRAMQLSQHSFGGNWTAFDNGYRLNISVTADRISGKVYYQGFRFDAGGDIDAQGKVDGWVTGVPWGTRYLRGTMPHLKLETLAKVNGANFTLERIQ